MHVISGYSNKMCVLCIQDGMQAIHCAAKEGYIELLTILIDYFGVDPQERANVCTGVKEI